VPAAPKRRLLPTQRAAVPAAAPRILLAEDNLVNQRVAQEMLQRLGYRVDIAANGREAVAAFAQGDYAAVLMDCQMPEMDGYEATAAIRRREGDDPKARYTPIIAMTANALEGDRERCLAAGMDDHLPKPVTTEKLVAVLQRWIPRDGPAAPGSEGEASRAGVPDDRAESLDATVLAGLRGLQQPGAPDLLSQLIELFLGDAAPRLAGLAQAVAQGDARALERQAHTLKGSSANIGARRLARLCEDLELLGRSGELGRAPGLLTQLEAEFDRVRAALRAEMAKVADEVVE
jgi:CheY-like chemotaxis protein/HPt (histidine-containing phosphotransfer) domain-containing protein